MSAQALCPKPELVKRQPGVHEGHLPDAVFAIDPGAIAEQQIAPEDRQGGAAQ